MSSDLPLPRIPEHPSDTRQHIGDLRGQSDPCYKCSVCESVCPVTAIDETFPGPKSQGPEQWRLRGVEVPIDQSIDACTNCLRCHAACPEDVTLALMHTVAREERASERPLSRNYVRNRLLANYGRLARLASTVPRVTNWALSNSLVRRLTETVLGITADRDAPKFAEQTFREWWNQRGGAHISSEDKRVAYFHGDYANYNTPTVGKAFVRVYESLGYEIAVPAQRCSGTPMFANGFLDDAERASRFNVEHLVELTNEGYDIVATCTSCSMALREEYPDLFDFDGVVDVSENTYDAIEYLRRNDELAGLNLQPDHLPEQLMYHSPCHASAQGVDGASIPVLEDAGVSISDLGEDCSGMSGTYGWKADRYEASMAIGQEMFEAMESAPGNQAIAECPTCAMQMNHGTGFEVTHPIELLAEGIDTS